MGDMVTFADLRDARPALWEAAADDILNVSKQAERTADNIHANGVAPLMDDWPDHTGAQAPGTLTQCAMPGDVVYFNYAQPHASGDVSHHTAVVTGVLPDGQILYTQHTPGAANLSVQDRLPMIEQSEGQQSITIVRPSETW
ncbi:hypothetical protein [Gordonia hankookensis]|uniref:Peptidase C51 domain-containing protein n=1 Tax=Gordonia hankookensis TaxID=589403 RepID=A0ABR7W858_9ACTN|nr:hypothetical protein [Gordonia hankookensis]MBD1318998.1 hypothetical protein [Gordonia hankookensis]